MVEIIKNLYVGSQNDFFNNNSDENVSFLLVAKDPFHKMIVGYKGNLSKDHEKYLMAYNEKGNVLALNLIDVYDPCYISKDMIDESLKFIDDQLNQDKKVIICCNQGESRSPSIGLAYLIESGVLRIEEFVTFNELEEFYKNKIYKKYNPKNGIRTVVEILFNEKRG